MERDRIIPTDKNLSKKDIVVKKEQFIYEYCKLMNWSYFELTSNQMLEISQKFKLK